jgi:regulatory protein
MEDPVDPLPADVDYDRALDRAMRLLTERARSRWEVRDRLRRAGFDDHVVAKVDARLVELAILDDYGFACLLAEQNRGRGISDSLIRVQLKGRGVDPETSDRAMADTESERDAERALDLARRRARTYGVIPPATAHRRLASLLLRKGYEDDLVAEVCRRVLGDPLQT